MQILGVVGAAGSGTTATTVNLTAALRRASRHAAVLDVTGDAMALFDIDADATLADVVMGDATASEADVTVELPHGDVSDALNDYAADLGHDPTAFRTGSVTVSPGEPEPGTLPVVVGGDRDVVGEADEEALDSALADLAFAYDFLVADAGTLGPSIAHLPDGIVTVTDTKEESVETAREGIAAYAREGLTVIGAVVNRAGERTDVSTLSDRLGVTVLAVVPADGRTQELEPIAFTAPETPAAAAYERLAAKIDEWDGSAGLVEGGPGGTVIADGDGPDASSDSDTVQGTNGSRGADLPHNVDTTTTSNDTDGTAIDGEATESTNEHDGEDDDDGNRGLFGRLTDRFR